MKAFIRSTFLCLKRIFEENTRFHTNPNSRPQTSHSSRPTSTRFDYFDGLRGMYVLIVVLRHGLDLIGSTCSDYAILDGIAVDISVVGFFMLSAFLLTYRLTKEIHNGLGRLAANNQADSSSNQEPNTSWDIIQQIKHISHLKKKILSPRNHQIRISTILQNIHLRDDLHID